MSDTKQVKVDNWGIYFLQRLKHFFNRTDYCDLTLQFQDNAQLKVHRLVLNACTEYFELLERTCEMYEDCLIMPDDLQAEVVVPIVNFMYTGQLEFEMELLEKLFQTSQIMNIPVLSKLLDAQRTQNKSKQVNPYQPKQSYSRSNKRPYNQAFEPIVTQPVEMKMHTASYLPTKKSQLSVPSGKSEKSKPIMQSNTLLVPRPQRKYSTIMVKTELSDPRPTRYEVPEELDSDNVYENSFMSISYDSKPLMIHPETSKRYQTKKPGFGLFTEASSSKKMHPHNTSLEVECRKIPTNDTLFDEDINDDSNYYKKTNDMVIKSESDPSLLFDQVVETNTRPKMVIETKDSKQASNIDHAKIISEVLKKYPHLVNSNKNIKLKILENPQAKSAKKPQLKKKDPPTQHYNQDWGSTDSVEEAMNVKEEHNTYEDVLNSKEAARLIALGAENIKGPWICLICGTPGKALHFPTYYKFRRHLVEVHREKAISNICEYCGLKSGKRNYLLHHMYTKHNVPPPPSYHFPKCNQCNYIALTEGFLVKHKASHADQRDFRCNVCFDVFKTSILLLRHIQATGHKFTGERKANLQCVYCQRVFLRESNLYAHLKTNHKLEAKRDGIVEDSDEEEITTNVKFETPAPMYEPDDDVNEIQFQIQSRPDGNIHVTRSPAMPRQKILNTGLKQSGKGQPRPPIQEDITGDNLSPQSTNLNEEMMITEQEYVNVNPMEQDSDQYYMPSMEQAEPVIAPKPSLNYVKSSIEQRKTLRHVKASKSVNSNDPIQIVMTNEQQIATPDHPVLFDSQGNPSKTLAVLTTLENAHSEDMMILPDDEYTINVTQEDTTTNQNIVVVYSHSMDSSKPYIVDPQYAQSKIITTKNTQFVQAPAVITPNYIATSTSEIIQTSPQVYQENIEQHVENVQVIEQNLIPEELHQEQAITTPTANITNASKSTEITEKELIGVDEVADETYVTIDSTEMQQELESPTFTQPDMEVHVPVTEAVQDQTIILPNDDVQQNEVIVEQNYETEVEKDKQSEVEEFIETHPEVTEDGQHINETSSTPGQEVSFDVNENNQEMETEIEESPEGMEIAEEILENEPESVQEEENNTEVPQPATVQVTIQSKEQIQSLASEWSEDEDDVPATVEKDCTAVAHPEVEESIENIQHEMEKDVTGVDTEEETEPENQELPKKMQELPAVSVAQAISSNGDSEAPQEKISSLLNDWDENDSQDENDTANNENEVPIGDNLPEDGNKIGEKSDAHLADDPSKAPLKVVKSLVSDWDEEEEEGKD